jgi:acyl carrier protein
MDAEGTVRTVLKQLEIDTDGVHDTTRLREDMQVDSTELVEIAVALERSAPVAIGTDDILAARTFADLVACVHNAPRR